MSQEINLLNPALREQRDWLSFRVVATAIVVCLLVLAAALAVLRIHLASTQTAQVATAAALTVVRQELQTLQATLAARKNDPALEEESTRLAAAIGQRREVLALAQGLAAEEGGVAEVMRGFSRQRMDGVWLTGFNAGPAGFDIRGRLLDPALLPIYIRRLNAEPAFRGRQFAALDMQGVVPPASTSGAAVPAEVAPAAGSGPRHYTEFVLQATLSKASTPGARE